MKDACARAAVGCLCIDELLSGQEAAGLSRLLELPDIAVRRFCCLGQGDLWEQLQVALHELRGQCRTPVAAAVGTGCLAALALAEQLPVERLALIRPRLIVDSGLPFSVVGRAMTFRNAPRPYRELRRLARFARRNLALYAGEMLVIRNKGDSAPAWRSGLSRHCRVTELLIDGKSGGKLYTNRENTLKEAISCFLRTGVLPKSLAENAEMCIIYG